MGTIPFTRARSLASLTAILLGSVAWSGGAQAQNATTNTVAQTQNRSPSTTPSRGPVDPGVRGGPPGAGGALPGLSDAERQFFEVSKEVFQEVDAGPDGLGPRFNLDSCSGCHSQPAI